MTKNQSPRLEGRTVLFHPAINVLFVCIIARPPLSVTFNCCLATGLGFGDCTLSVGLALTLALVAGLDSKLLSKLRLRPCGKGSLKLVPDLIRKRGVLGRIELERECILGCR